jgi:hypothetical protein
MVTEINGLVDVERGLVSRGIFIERAIYEQELERIFARCRRFLCHQSQIPRSTVRQSCWPTSMGPSTPSAACVAMPTGPWGGGNCWEILSRAPSMAASSRYGPDRR